MHVESIELNDLSRQVGLMWTKYYLILVKNSVS